MTEILIKCVVHCIGGWQNSSGGGPPGQYNRGQYPPQPGPQQQWNSGQRPSGPSGPAAGASGQPGAGQWDQHRYPPQSQQPPYPPGQQVNLMNNILSNGNKM